MAANVVNHPTRIRKSTCQLCERNVHIVLVDGRALAVDPEVIAVVAAGLHGGVLSDASLMNGRRVHAELCDTYRQNRERENTRRELRAFNRKNGRRGTGL